ncbi:MAG: DUF4433 domain-containing protein [Myxococcales bacterium]|nr:DUF4433 domain-containing protein [Myxococcales bacterium]
MDPRVTEFHCIMPLRNIPSVLEHGILSYEQAAKLSHASVAMEEVQERRDQKRVPNGLRLHQYANLYFHARNPMLFKRKDQAHELCVLCVSTQVATLAGVVFADCNASSDYVRFLAPSQWSLLPLADIYAMDWRHPDDPVAFYRHRSRKCAEVLVPHRVARQFLIGAKVKDAATQAALTAMKVPFPVHIDPVLFFGSPSGARLQGDAC